MSSVNFSLPKKGGANSVDPGKSLLVYGTYWTNSIYFQSDDPSNLKKWSNVFIFKGKQYKTQRRSRNKKSRELTNQQLNPAPLGS